MTDSTDGTATTQDHAAEPLAKLARMANQIGDFFKAYPEEQAVAAIADHINQFWTKRMREDFLAAFATDSERLPALVRKALGKIRPAHNQG